MTSEPKRNSDINSLSDTFKKKFTPFWQEVIAKYPNAMVFEALRSKERQKWLYGVGRTHSMERKPITWTINSKHLTGDAVDIVFKDSKGTPTWVGPYDDLIVIAKKYGIKNLKPKETCHFEDDGVPIRQYTTEEKQNIALTEKQNSRMRTFTDNKDLKELLNQTNSKIRDLYKGKY